MPQGDPCGPFICSLWFQAGVTLLQTPGVLTSTYLDDRCIVSDTSIQLQDQVDRWSSWSHSVGFLENGLQTVVSGRLKRLYPESCLYWSICQRLDSGSWRLRYVLCAVPLSGWRVLAVRTADLLGTLGFSFSRCLQLLRAFALSKANFGWIGHTPTWAASSKLWTRCWSSAVCRSCSFLFPLGGMSALRWQPSLGRYLGYGLGRCHCAWSF